MSQPRIMPNGEIHYTRRGKDLPLAIQGYQRKSDRGADAWIFIPVYPPCANRDLRLYQRGCGSTGVHLVCGKTQSICKHAEWNPCKDII